MFLHICIGAEGSKPIIIKRAMEAFYPQHMFRDLGQNTREADEVTVPSKKNDFDKFANWNYQPNHIIVDTWVIIHWILLLTKNVILFYLNKNGTSKRQLGKKSFNTIQHSMYINRKCVNSYQQ